MSAVPGGPDVMLAESVMFVVFMMSQVPRRSLSVTPWWDTESWWWPSYSVLLIHPADFSHHLLQSADISRACSSLGLQVCDCEDAMHGLWLTSGLWRWLCSTRSGLSLSQLPPAQNDCSTLNTQNNINTTQLSSAHTDTEDWGASRPTSHVAQILYC